MKKIGESKNRFIVDFCRKFSVILVFVILAFLFMFGIPVLISFMIVSVYLAIIEKGPFHVHIGIVSFITFYLVAYFISDRFLPEKVGSLCRKFYYGNK